MGQLKGHLTSEETRKKIRLKMKGRKNPEHSKWMKENHPLLGKTRLDMQRENNPNWKGGRASLRLVVWTTKENAQWRLKILERDNFTCQMPGCNQRGGKLEVNHIKLWSLIAKENNIKTLDDARNCAELWDLNNGITLCYTHHRGIRKKEAQFDNLFRAIISIKKVL